MWASQNMLVISHLISKESIRELANKHGFELCAFTKPLIASNHQTQLDQWSGAGMHGEMSYMAEESRVERRKSPESMLDSIKTVITVAMKHQSAPYSLEESLAVESRGVIATYAHGDDYHDVMK
ncbi:MAG: QueG-associated DUF1730 domain-containing protein, partial [Mariprofundaceae bacterium]